MKNLTTKCIILGHKNFGEKDKLIFLYSDDIGKIKAIAKGSRSIKSKFTGHLETLNFCTATLYFGPKNIILQEIVTDQTFFKTRKNLYTIVFALFIAKITNNMLYENQTIDNLTNLLKETIIHLKKSRKKQLISSHYILTLMEKSGVLPEFKKNSLLHTIKSQPLNKMDDITLTKKNKAYLKKFIDTLVEKETISFQNY